MPKPKCVVVGNHKPGNLVSNPALDIKRDTHLIFTFDLFRAEPINIEGIFNNYYKDSEEFIRKFYTLFGMALPQLSKEDASIFSDISKLESMHMHPIHDKQEELTTIFKEYGYSQEYINNFLEGAEIYQFEVPYENGASRVVFERIDGNLLSFLFLDPNHHVYMNKEKVDRARSLFFEYCPVYNVNECKRMDYFKTCFAYEFLDEEKYKKTFSNDYSPKTNK